ncbi:MAG TPA: GntG family PLP-dependent aldolase, partial [Anaerolineae bacterium]
IHPHTIPNQPDGTLKIGDIQGAIRSENDHFPVTRMIGLENTHNRMGGTVLTPEYTRQVADLAHAHDIKLHIDGARIYNAAVALGVDVKELTSRADSITFCLSKGLSAPVGSVLCGKQEFIRLARKRRKMIGGGMRQGGVLAAAGIVALDQQVDHLHEDHANARKLAEGIARTPGLLVDMASVQTNMVYFDLDASLPFDADELCRRLGEYRVKINSSAVHRIRAVTHCWVSSAEIDEVVHALGQCMRS